MRMIKLKLFITVAAAVFAFICIGAVNQTNAHAATAPNVKAEMRNPGGANPYILITWNGGYSAGKGWGFSKSINGGSFVPYSFASQDSGVSRDDNLTNGYRYTYKATWNDGN